jgi:hypothetical protein
MVASEATAAVGGTIADGKYHLVDIALFTGTSVDPLPLNTKVSNTYVFKGNVVYTAAHGPNGVVDKRETVVTSGTSVTFTESCPTIGKPPITATYSVEGDDVVLLMANDLGMITASRYSPAP